MTRYICDCEELALPREEYCESCDQYKKLEQEADVLRRKLALVKGCSHPGYIAGMHWLSSAYHRICAGEPERQVMIDYGYIMERDE